MVNSAPANAQVFNYPAPPANPYANPWVGPNTPWVYYNGDWFLNGILHYFFGPQYGWAPYYAYAPTYVVRPSNWYGPMWLTWYKERPVYYRNFYRDYPYWVGHREGHRYNRVFYERHHRGQGGGWHKGFHDGSPKRIKSDGRRFDDDRRGRSEGKRIGDDRRGRSDGKRISDDRGGRSDGKGRDHKSDKSGKGKGKD
jgi:hypothetical protein